MFDISVFIYLFSATHIDTFEIVAVKMVCSLWQYGHIIHFSEYLVVCEGMVLIFGWEITQISMVVYVKLSSFVNSIRNWSLKDECVCN